MDLSHLFRPRSLAIIGMSRSAPSLGHMILNNLESSEYKGEIYLVNPKADKIENRKVYHSIDDLPKIDVAIAITAPYLMESVLEGLGENDCQFVIIITAGFTQEQEKNMVKLAKKYSIRLLGPNSMGSFGWNANMSFSPIPISNGSIGLISQSGSIVVVAQESLTSEGFSVFASLGNKTDIEEIEILEFMKNDDQTKVIVAYLESFSDPIKLKKVLLGITPLKPVIIVKGGRTYEGSRAVSSHTGALSGDYRLTKALLKDCGVIEVPSIQEAMGLAEYICKFGIAQHQGIVTISSAGGPGVLAADEITEMGLKLSELSDKTKSRLNEIIPSSGNSSNPLDLVADAGISRYIDVLKQLKEDSSVTTIILIVVHPVLIKAQELFDKIDQLGMPVICAYLGRKYIEFSEYNNIITYQSTRDIAQLLVHINEYAKWLELSHQTPLKLEEKTKTRSNIEEVLRNYGFSFPPQIITDDYKTAIDWFSINNPIAVKISHPKFSHKTDKGGVILNISSEIQLKQAWDQLLDIYRTTTIPQDQWKLQLQGYLEGGLEFLLGGIRDPLQGAFLIIGEGGTLVEYRNDTSLIPIPTTKNAIRTALESLKFNQILEGYRGKSSINRKKLIDTILLLDKVMQEHPDIEELDINPLYLLPSGDMIVLDYRWKLSDRLF